MAEAQVDQMERFLAVHEKSHHLVKQEKGENVQNMVATCLLLATHLKILPHK